MKGHLEQRSKGSWTCWVELDRDPVTKKRRRQTLTVHGTKKEAEAKLRDLLHQLDTGVYVKPVKGTLGEYLTSWIQDYAWPNLAPKTAQNYEHMVNKHLIPALGAVQLGQLRGEHIQHLHRRKAGSRKIGIERQNCEAPLCYSSYCPGSCGQTRNPGQESV
jgi:hypothetical protein